MKKQLLTLSIITALSACGSSDDDNTKAQAPATFSGDLSVVLSKAENPELRVEVDDPNKNESLIHSEVIEGKYGELRIDAAGFWTYELYVGEDEHPDVTALVSSENADISENPLTIKSADGTTQDIQITLEGIDVPATFKDRTSVVISHDTGSIDAFTSVRDDNPAEAAFKPALEQEGAQEVDGEVKITTQYGVVTINVIEPVDAIEGVEASEGVEEVEAVPAVLGKVEWTYEIDPDNEEARALNYDVEPEDSSAIPTLDDTFTLTTLDGTEQEIVVTLRGSLKVPADIDALPGGIDVELTEEEIAEGVEPVVNPDAVVNINAGDTSGNLVITDPNLAEESFEIQEDITTTYGTFTIDANGAWTYALDTDSAEIKAHKGDGVTKPAPLIDNIVVTAADGTEAVLPITIDPLVGGNLVAEVGSDKDGKFVVNTPAAAWEKGRVTFKFQYPEASSKDAKVILNGRKYKGTELNRTIIAMAFRSNGEIKLYNGTSGTGTFVIDQTHTPGIWNDMVFTWDGSEATRGANGGNATVSISINDTPISSAGGEILANQVSGEFFKSFTNSAAFGLMDEAQFFEVQAKGGSSVYLDDLTIYSDEAGNTEVLSENFDELAEGAALSVDYTFDAQTKEVMVSPVAKPE
ncbi:VCBS domain-containing protein [Catenovulum adriaticum]|uniref:VCBS domain-containing protein n=1 Tax=Catenovulum adriaticum TaxID=2984846 RepID=A0ABY7AQQ4_9ALTE|nr:VCBS domain-containing protein [Catenovulum sp. TS8]WAJ71655.1 VCBS domain-containing protein [Catenovulum sp. TS8]